MIPVNDLGEGSPCWFSGSVSSGLIHDYGFSLLQDYVEQSCNAVPTSEAGSKECTETKSSTFTITAPSVPPPPIMEVGPYLSVSNRNRFIISITVDRQQLSEHRNTHWQIPHRVVDQPFFSSDWSRWFNFILVSRKCCVLLG